MGLQSESRYARQGVLPLQYIGVPGLGTPVKHRTRAFSSVGGGKTGSWEIDPVEVSRVQATPRGAIFSQCQSCLYLQRQRGNIRRNPSRPFQVFTLPTFPSIKVYLRTVPCAVVQKRKFYEGAKPDIIGLHKSVEPLTRLYLLDTGRVDCGYNTFHSERNPLWFPARNGNLEVARIHLTQTMRA